MELFIHRSARHDKTAALRGEGRRLGQQR